MILHRHITARLWRFYLFRLFVTSYVMTGWPGTTWLMFETPMMCCLKQMLLDLEDWPNAADAQRLTDEYEAKRLARGHGGGSAP